MAFVKQRFVEASFLELAIDVAGENADTVCHPICPSLEHGKAGVRCGVPIERKPVAVKAPCLPRIVQECGGRGYAAKLKARLTQRGIGPPEAFVAAKIRQARVNSHPGAGGNNQSVGLFDQLGGLFEKRCKCCWRHAVYGQTISEASVFPEDTRLKCELVVQLVRGS